MDEWVMERYKLAKERIVQIPEENIVKMPYQDFFIKEAEFLQKVISVMDENQEQDKTLEELQAQNYELYQDVLMKILMEILHMHRKCWENMEELLLSFIQNCMEPLAMLLKKKSGILQ